jgi:DNA-binding NarL/FixJ family response regulator
MVKTARSPANRIAVVLVEPLHVVRSGLRLLIDQQPDMAVVAEAASAESALEAVHVLPGNSPVVVIVSLGLPNAVGGAYPLMTRIREREPQMPILAMGANADEMTLARSQFAGADGFADKCSTTEEFVSAIRDTAAGETAMAGVATDRLGAVAEGLNRHRADGAKLSARELEVVAAAAEGLTARQIARRLGLRERTVTTHLSRVYTKLGVTNRMAAVASVGRSGALKRSNEE